MVLDNLSITKILLLRLLQQIKVIVNPKRRSNIKKVEAKSRWSERAPYFSTVCAKYLLLSTVNEKNSLFSGQYVVLGPRKSPMPLVRVFSENDKIFRQEKKYVEL